MVHIANMLTVSIINQKGGVGKSTLAANLAAAGHLRGLRTLVLDLDKQGSALDWYASRQEGSKLSGLNVVKTDKALSLPKFRELSKSYELVVCDGPPRLSDISRAAATASDICVIPLRAGPQDFWSSSETVELLDTADAIRSEIGLAPIKRFYVLNSLSAGTNLAKRAKEALAEMGCLATTSIHHRVAFPESFFDGESALTTQPDGRAAAEITALYDEVTS